MPPDDDLVVARVKSAWGMKGDLNVEVFSDVRGRFAPGSILYLGRNPIRVERSRPVRRGLVVKLEGVDDRGAAESYRGMPLTVALNAIEPLEEGTYYHLQIVGIDVWTEDDEHLGKVSEILVTGANDVYVVRGKTGGEVLVPAIRDVIVEVNLQDNRMVVSLPEGLR